MPELIDRSKVLKYLTPRIKTETPYGEGYNKALEDSAALVALMPTIEAEPVRHGRWIEETEPDENGNVTAMCNQCYHTDEHCKNIKPPYCWYCGERMDATDTNVGGKGCADNDS
jgi:hypothetical protein